MLKPIALGIEFGKAIFSHTIGLQSLIDYLPQTRPLSEWHLPALATVPRKSSYGRGANYYDESQFFKRGVFTVRVNYLLPLYLLNYVARNVGKVVGGILGCVAAFLTSPYMIGRALYDCNEAKKEILLKVEKAQNAKKNHEATIAKNMSIISSPKNLLKTVNESVKDPVSDSPKVSFSSPIHEGLKGRNQNQDAGEEKRYLLAPI